MTAEKCETGSSLLVWVMFLVPISLLLVTVMAMMPMLRRTAVAEQDYGLALHTAESGIRHAFAWLNDPNSKAPSGQTKETFLAGGIPGTVPNGGAYTVRLSSSDGHRYLVSDGTYNGRTRRLQMEITKGEGAGLALDHALFAAGKDTDTVLTMEGSSWIDGDVGINTTKPGSVWFAWSTSVSGAITTPPGGTASVVSGARPKPVGSEGNVPVVSSREDTADYVLPPFPEFPSLPYKGDFTAGWWPSPPYYIDSSGYYDNFTVNSTLIVNFHDSDIEIHAKNFNVTDSGNITLNNPEDHKLIIYVDNSFKLTGSSTINGSGSSKNVALFYKGSDNFTVDGATKLVGAAYLEKANFDLGGSGGLTGSLITGSTSLKITGDAQAYVRAIYAPNANVVMEGSGHLRGALVCKSLKMSGATSIIYAENSGADLPVPIGGSGGDGTGTYTAGKWSVMK